MLRPVMLFQKYWSIPLFVYLSLLACLSKLVTFVRFIHCKKLTNFKNSICNHHRLSISIELIDVTSEWLTVTFNFPSRIVA